MCVFESINLNQKFKILYQVDFLQSLFLMTEKQSIFSDITIKIIQLIQACIQACKSYFIRFLFLHNRDVFVYS